MGLYQLLTSDPEFETLIRQLAAAKEYRITGDAAASSHVLGIHRPEDSVLPSWLAEDSRAFSTAMYKQGVRTRGSKGGGKSKDKGKPSKGSKKGGGK